MPSLAVNSNNVILVGFSGSNPNNYISALYSGVRADGATLIPPVMCQAGTTYDDGTFPAWGDYSFTSVDPTDNRTLWTIQGFVSNTGYRGSPWADWITSITTSP